jgi:tRNA-specific 2-thiouridylase
VRGEDFENVLFPVGDYLKSEVRELAREARLPVADKKDSTGICFIGERPYDAFLSHYVPRSPGPIRTPGGDVLGRHHGLAFYTLGQRHGLILGGRKGFGEAPWYVAGKVPEENALIVVQGRDHALLLQNWLHATDVHWISTPPQWRAHGTLRCTAKTRYRQPDVACTVSRLGEKDVEVLLDAPQRAVTPGQYVVLYDGAQCLGGATIVRSTLQESLQKIAIQAH